MGKEKTDNVITLVPRSVAPPALHSTLPGERVQATTFVKGREVRIREATERDVPHIQALYALVYQGRYSMEFATNPSKLSDQLARPESYLLLVAEDPGRIGLVGSILFSTDAAHRLGKAAGVVVDPDYRSGGLGGVMLKLGTRYLAEEAGLVDVMYATSRTVGEAPSRIVAEAGYQQVGLFPNAVQVETMEHLNLDVYLTERALPRRRKKPFIFKPYHETYEIARRRLGFERAQVVSEYASLKLSERPMEFDVITDETAAVSRFKELALEKRVANSFFPFHSPNLIFRCPSGHTEVFVSLKGRHRQAAILGYRTDMVDIQDVLDSVALALHKQGASYVEFLIDAHDYRLQQQAYTARYIPSAYFPAMRLGADGLRDDVIIVSRTFSLLDFTGSVLRGDNLKYLKAYFRHYHELYIKPILGK
jgi:N-acetylglutamate synthase-like GNAT family acetyltransferase